MRRDRWGTILVHSGRTVTLLAFLVALVVGWVLSEGPRGFFPSGFLFGFIGLGTVGFAVSGAGYRLCRQPWASRPGVRFHGLLLAVSYSFFLLLVVSR